MRQLRIDALKRDSVVKDVIILHISIELCETVKLQYGWEIEVNKEKGKLRPTIKFDIH